MIERSIILRCDVCDNSIQMWTTLGIRDFRHFCRSIGWVCARDGTLEYCPKCRETATTEQLDGARRVRRKARGSQ
jgi:hypothetical protein